MVVGPKIALIVLATIDTLFTICILYAQPVPAEKPKYQAVVIGKVPVILGDVLPFTYNLIVPAL